MIRFIVHALIKLFNRLIGYRIWGKGEVPEIKYMKKKFLDKSFSEMNPIERIIDLTLKIFVFVFSEGVLFRER